MTDEISSGLTWTEHRIGSGATLTLVPGLTLSVTFSPIPLPDISPKWDVYVLGSKLTQRSYDKEQTQRRAERVARSLLQTALNNLIEVQNGRDF